jgi:hypothetical protein
MANRYIEALQARIVYLESVLRGGADVSLSPGTMIDATNEYHASDAMGMDLSADQEAVSPNAEPESLSKFLGEASGVKLGNPHGAYMFQSLIQSHTDLLGLLSAQ